MAVNSTLCTNVENMELVTKKLKQLSNKLKKYGHSLDYTVGKSYMKKITLEAIDGMGDNTGEDFTYYEEMVDVTFNEDSLNFMLMQGNYKLIARKERGDIGTFIKIYDDSYSDKLEQFQSEPIACEHCNTKRTRKVSYMILDIDTNKLIQVGRSCVGDYLGSMDILNRLSIYETAIALDFSDTFIGNDINPSRFYSVCEIGSILLMILDKHEFIKASDGYSTADMVRDAINNLNPMYWGKFLVKEGYRLTEGNRRKADKMIEKLVNCSMPKILNNSFSSDVINICKNGVMGYKHVGMFVYIVSVYNRIIEEESKINDLILNHTYYNGSTGDKLQGIQATYLNSFTFETYFNYYGSTSYIHKFVDEEGHIFIWKTSKFLKLEKGDTVKLSGAIKEFNEYNSEKQTILTRCKVVQ